MSAPLRFLAIAVAGWTVVRAMAVGILPDAGGIAATPGYAAVPPVVPTQFPPIEGPQPYAYAAPAYATYPPPPPAPAAYQVYPYYVPASAPRQWSATRPPTQLESVPRFNLAMDSQPRDDFPWRRSAGMSRPAQRSSAAVFAPLQPRPAIDRLQLTSWALLRSRSLGSSEGLATGGTLGGSQAGARLTYNFDRRFAATLRGSSPAGGARGGEVAAGLKLTPFANVPLSITAERRQAVGRGGGRNAFALFVEGGVYRRPMPWRFELDAYGQAGIVGARRRDLFADGAFTFTRPVWGRYSAGFGMWGGAQPGLYRIDAGPRVTMKVRDNIRIHLDWRQRIAGSANPASGPALTLAGDF